MTIKNEHNQHCVEIADSLHEIATGGMVKCEECGEWFQVYDVYGAGYQVDEDGNEICVCPSCGHIHDDYPEDVTIFDYLENALDFQYTFNANRELIGGRVLVAFGGPNIWVDTVHKSVDLYWWNEEGHAELGEYACDEINQALDAIWGC